jgi:hypothetical protein
MALEGAWGDLRLEGTVAGDVRRCPNTRLPVSTDPSLLILRVAKEVEINASGAGHLARGSPPGPAAER